MTAVRGLAGEWHEVSRGRDTMPRRTVLLRGLKDRGCYPVARKISVRVHNQWTSRLDPKRSGGAWG